MEDSSDSGFVPVGDLASGASRFFERADQSRRRRWDEKTGVSHTDEEWAAERERRQELREACEREEGERQETECRRYAAEFEARELERVARERQERIESRIARSGVPELWRPWTPDTCTDAANRVAKPAIDELVGSDGLKTVWLWSGPKQVGMGKSGLAAAYVLAACREGRRAYFEDMGTFSLRMMLPPERVLEYLEQRAGADLLVLDDIDKQYVRPGGEWVPGLFYNLCNAISRAPVKVIVTANRGPNAMVARLGDDFGDSVISRLQPMRAVEVVGPDVRPLSKWTAPGDRNSESDVAEAVSDEAPVLVKMDVPRRIESAPLSAEDAGVVDEADDSEE